jgi:hypothetical protein
MPTSLDEQIMDQVATKLATITTGNGYEQTVVAVHRPPVGPLELEVGDCPALIVRKFSKVSRMHLRGAEEMLIGVKVLCVVEADQTDSNERLQDLIADVKKLVYVNKRWHNGSSNLAQRTWVDEDQPHETEVVEGNLTGSVLLRILARADITNPYTVKAV